MKRKKWKLIAFLIVLGIVGTLGGCQGEKQEETMPTPEAMNNPVEFVSDSGKMSIMLPDDSWKMAEDTESLCMFSSKQGIIMLSKTQDTNLVVPESTEDVRKVLQKEGYSSENYEVIEYSEQNIDQLKSYRTVVRYEGDNVFYTYGILYGTILGDKEYMATAMLYGDDEAELERVKTSIYSFEVTPDEMTPEPTKELIPEATPTPEATPEQQATPTAEPTPEPTPQPTPEPTPTPEPEPIWRTVKQSGNLRTGPGDAYDLIMTISAGNDVLVYGQENGWYDCEYNGARGYLYKRFLD